jgi:hypothetical protein
MVSDNEEANIWSVAAKIDKYRRKAFVDPISS